MTFFERNNSDAADVDLEIWKNNYSGDAPTYRLREDDSFDVKSMTKASEEAAGQALCAKVLTSHVPDVEPGVDTRKVILIMYYSDSTAFR